jgi:hypothetical protein
MWVIEDSIAISDFMSIRISNRYNWISFLKIFMINKIEIFIVYFPIFQNKGLSRNYITFFSTFYPSVAGYFVWSSYRNIFISYHHWIGVHTYSTCGETEERSCLRQQRCLAPLIVVCAYSIYTNIKHRLFIRLQFYFNNVSTSTSQCHNPT